MQNPYRPIPARIDRIVRVRRDVKTYTLSLLNAEDEAFQPVEPGQFIMISVPGLGEAAFSVSSWNSEGRVFDTTIRRVGRLTSYLDGLSEGDEVGVRGPYGRGWPLKESEGKDILLIAGGIGLAPLKPVISYIAHNRERYGLLEILYGARTPDELIFMDEYDAWRRIKDTILRLTVDMVPKGVIWDYNVGLVPILIEDVEVRPEGSEVMVCGPEVMMHFVVKALTSRGFSEDQIYLSLERRMKCGIGQCGHCQIGSKYVCRDGPVFSYAEIMGLPDVNI
ncbi:MAG: FAD/NAD(P)-binding protein [Candidatus Bathyarchaeia archaeon]|nr:FAD/NAD(P)-binding protein [Candidatus Bathyarchaeota archaeon]